MKTIFPYLFVFCSVTLFAQNNEWTWETGDSIVAIPSVFGTKGLASPTNKPGCRWLSVSFSDASGNFWLYGGTADPGGATYYMGDLWNYNKNTNEWTWVSGDSARNTHAVYGTRGLAAVVNKPGAKTQAVSWTDHNGNLWLFGGAGSDASANFGSMSSLWKYDVTAGNWAWINGDTTLNSKSKFATKGTPEPGNKPGSTVLAYTWTDTSGNLWLYGGAGYDGAGTYGYFSTLWKYNIAIDQWTWVSGDTLVGAITSFGNKGVANPANTPGGRLEGVSYADHIGNLWLFGGYGVTAINVAGEMNDLWKYNIANNEWTWVNGDITPEHYGHYGTKGVPDPANTPRSSRWSVGWTGLKDNLWLWGGYGYGGLPNALWKFDPSNTEWTWVSGDSVTQYFGRYGTKGVSAPTNNPGSRMQAIGFTDPDGDLWLFGGDGFPASTVNGNLNDLWKFHPGPIASGPTALFTTSANRICVGDTIFFTDRSTGIPTSWNWSFPGGTPLTSTEQNPAVIYHTSGTYDAKLRVSNSLGNDSLTKTDSVQVNPLPSPLPLVASDSVICAGDSATICSPTGFTSYLWNTQVTNNCTVAKEAGDYWVFVTDSNGCQNTSPHISLAVHPPTAVSISIHEDTLVSFNGFAYQWLLNGDTIAGAHDSIYVARQSGEYSVQIIDTNGCSVLSDQHNVVISGILDPEGNSFIYVYPNPFSNSISIQTFSTPIKELALYDALGREVLRLVSAVKSSTAPITMDVSKLAEGLYFLKISFEGGEGTQVQKLSKK